MANQNEQLGVAKPCAQKKTKLRDGGQLYIVRSRAGILLERHPPSGCSNDPLLVYLDRTAAAVSKKAWYDLMASGADIVANQSVLSPWTFGTASKTALILAGGASRSRGPWNPPPSCAPAPRPSPTWGPSSRSTPRSPSRTPWSSGRWPCTCPRHPW